LWNLENGEKLSNLAKLSSLESGMVLLLETEKGVYDQNSAVDSDK